LSKGLPELSQSNENVKLTPELEKAAKIKIMKKLMIQYIPKCRDVDQDKNMIKGRKPMQIYQEYQSDFIKKCLFSKDFQNLQ
jgi:hypothetical protein